MGLSVSVIIPTFNRASVIARAVESVIVQLADGDELIVVDDGSTDDTARALARFGPRVRLISVENGGAGRARNRGVSEARGDLVAFLDSDDEWMPGKLALTRRWLEARPDTLFVFSDFAATDSDGMVHRRHLINWHGDPRTWNEILGPGAPFSSVASLPEGRSDFQVYVGSLYEREFERAYVLTSSLVTRRVAAGDALHFCEDVPTQEDLECFGRLARRGAAAYFDTETVWQHGGAGDRLSGIEELHRLAANLVVLDRVWGADRSFLATHGDAYRRVLDRLHLKRAAIFLNTGRMSEARHEVAGMTDAPLRYRVLMSLPPLLISAVLMLRKWLSFDLPQF